MDRIIYDAMGNELSRTEAKLTQRLSKVFKKDGESGMKLIGELQALTDKDKADFTAMFNECGYPIVLA